MRIAELLNVNGSTPIRGFPKVYFTKGYVVSGDGE